MSLGEEVIGEEENDVIVSDVASMAVRGDEDVSGAGNYVAEVCGNLRPRRGEDMARGQ